MMCTNWPARDAATREVITQFLQYAVAGGLAFGVDAGLLLLLTTRGGYYYLVSAAVSFVAGLLVNYTLSRFWIFNRRTLSNTSLEFTVFASIGVIGLFLTQALMWGFTEGLGFHYFVSKCAAAGFVLIWSFGARKWILF